MVGSERILPTGAPALFLVSNVGQEKQKQPLSITVSTSVWKLVV